jgi:hypothetical protein
MSDRVKWFETSRGVWEGCVASGAVTYIIVPLPADKMPFGCWVARAGEKDGRHMTNVDRAMDVAEMQETMDHAELLRWGLLLEGGRS